MKKHVRAKLKKTSCHLCIYCSLSHFRSNFIGFSQTNVRTLKMWLSVIKIFINDPLRSAYAYKKPFQKFGKFIELCSPFAWVTKGILFWRKKRAKNIEIFKTLVRSMWKHVLLNFLVRKFHMYQKIFNINNCFISRTIIKSDFFSISMHTEFKWTLDVPNSFLQYFGKFSKIIW